MFDINFERVTHFCSVQKYDCWHAVLTLKIEQGYSTKLSDE
jgi:hypothetical protein